MDAEIDLFSSSYSQARARFLQAAQAAGASVRSYPLELPGRDGEALAIDCAWQGPRDAAKLLILSSGAHGVEGFGGSGAQIALLRDPAFRESAVAAGAAVLYLHALNPHGFSHIRRVTQENVDLNRNFQRFDQPLPANPAYCKLHPRLLPPTWPPTLGNRLAVIGLIATQGIPKLQIAISGGQYERPDGLFYGGTAPTWSHRTLRQILRDHGGGVKRLAWIDLHTGLGKSGQCERGFMGNRDDIANYDRANRWWGQRVPLRHIGSATSVSASLAGPLWVTAPQECPQAEVTGMYMEFGTVPILEVLRALRGDHWLHLHPEAPPALQKDIKRRLLDAFFVDTPAWKHNLLNEVRQAVGQAIDGLSTTS